jgi:hypothetical protein
MRLIIHNLRAGFATNSSSSHSVILLPPEMIGTLTDESVPYDGGYGQNDFRLVSTEQKMRYLAAQLFRKAVGNDQVRRSKFIEAFRPHVPDIAGVLPEDSDGYDFYVDHESQMTLPNDPMRPAFLKNIMKVFMSDQVIVTGGGGDTMYEIPEAQDEPLSRALMRETYASRVRQDGEYLVIYNKDTGNKIRMSDDAAPPYVKASTPELVDLKITDYCEAGCNFCYQSSTKSGKHAPFKQIEKTLDMLREMDVFEVAIGGGEPTEHPEFGAILKAVETRNMTANFTTLSNQWLSNPGIVKAVQQHAKAIGVSCSSAKGLTLVDEINAVVNPRTWKTVKVMAQHVVGAVPLWVTAEFISAAFAKEIPVLLLGYKEVGFGKTFQRHDEGQDVAFFLRMAVQNHPKASLSVDTALLDQHPDIPKVLNVPIALTTSPEGKFSCYIDAVTRTMGASSYVEPSQMVGLPKTAEAFTKIFSTY